MNFIRNPLFEVIVAGICAGAWPMVMKMSGLNGNAMGALYGFLTFLPALVLILFGGLQGVELSSVKWFPALLAGTFGGIALLSMSDALQQTTQAQMALLYVIMLAVQTMIPVIWFMVEKKSVSVTQIAGILCIISGIVLLKSKPTQ